MPAAFLVRSAPFAALAVTVGAFGMLVYLFLVDHRQRRPLCCSNVSRTLLSFTNRSIDPCSDFAGYACYHRKALRKRALATNAVKMSVVYPTLQGRLRTPASESLRSHHRSCLVAFINGELTPERIAISVLSMFQKWAPASNQLDLLKVLGLLFLRYDVPMLLSASFSFDDSGKGSSRYILKVAPVVTPPLLLPLARDTNVLTRMIASLYPHLLQKAAAKAERAVSLDLRDNILKVSLRLRESVQGSDDSVVDANATNIEHHFAHVDLSSWREIIAECCGSWKLNIQDLSSVRNVLNALTDGATEHQVLVAYFTVSAAIAMFSEEIDRISTAGGLIRHAGLCDEIVSRAVPLWLVSSTAVLAAGNKDEVVRAVYAATLEAVASDAEVLFPDASNARKARQVLTELRLLLPQDLAQEYAPFLPDLSGRYMENKLELSRYLYRVRIVDAKHAVSRLSVEHVKDLEGVAYRSGNAVVVAPGVYTMLCLRKGCDIDAACELNAATLGVTLADLLWEALFERLDWSPEILRRLDEHQSCLRQSSRSSYQGGPGFGDLSFPLLSVRAAARVAADPSWHVESREPLFDDWELSPSQVFFLLVFLTRACFGSPGRTEDDDDSPTSLPAQLFRRMADFNAAFQCGLPPAFSMGSCM